MFRFNIDGEYRRAKGHRYAYQYQASWYDSGGDGVVWSASVTRNGNHCGTPGGTIGAESIPRMMGRVKCEVEKSIENLVGVEE